MSEFGQVPDDLGIRFNAIQTPTEDKLADIISKKANCIYEAYNAGIITLQMALKELQELSYGSNMFTSITNEIIEAAKDAIISRSETDLVGEDYGVETPTQNRNGLPETTNEPI
jgi:hypothetical protein